MDLGTGSGCLVVTLAREYPRARYIATDISEGALTIARANAERHGVAERIVFKEGDLLSTVPAEPLFNFIVSNPPYVSTAEMAELAKDVREHEPDIALRAGERGTDVIVRLVEQSAARLKPGGVLLMEISPMIAADVEQLIRDSATFELGPTIRDLAGHPRIVQATVVGTLRVP